MTFRLPRWAFLAYGTLALALSVGLLVLGQQRSLREAGFWLVAYGVVALLALRVPQVAPLAGGSAALLTGFARTYRPGLDPDLGLSVIALSTGLYVLDRWRRRDQREGLDLAGVLLFLVAVWAVVSFGFSLARIVSFTPAPGFHFHWYRFNPAGLSAREAVIHSTIGATMAFVWFGLYEFARRMEIERRTINIVVFVLLLANGTTLLVQRYVDPTFLHPIGFPPVGRLNGLTSFCYALGDATLALFLLLPAWGVVRGAGALLTGGSLVLLTHAVMASGSRTALAAAMLATVLWVCVHAARSFRAERRAAATLQLAAGALLLGAVVATYSVTPAGHATPLERHKLDVGRVGRVSGVFSGRLSSYPLIFRVLQAFPLSGVGAGLYPAEVGKQHALLTPDLDVLQPYLLASFAPNQFLNTGVELGVPPMAALLAVFALAGWNALPRPGVRGSPDRLVSLLALCAALQVGPSFYNSEALVFFWLVVGRAASSGARAGNGFGRGRAIGSRATLGTLAVAAVVAVAGHLVAAPSLSIDTQWKRLRWPMNIGLKARHENGRWTAPEATFTVRTSAPDLRVRWHTGDRDVGVYSAVVSFYVDGVLVERAVARSGRIRETVLPLTRIPGVKRVSVLVSPPFIPAEEGQGSDQRQLGIFIHSVEPVTAATEPGSEGGRSAGPSSETGRTVEAAIR